MCVFVLPLAIFREEAGTVKYINIESNNIHIRIYIYTCMYYIYLYVYIYMDIYFDIHSHTNVYLCEIIAIIRFP